MNKLKKIIKNAIDLHVHIGPEMIPRKYNSISSLVQSLNGRLAGVALKNHFFSTVPMSLETGTDNINIIGSVVLNSFTGGINKDTVFANRTLTNKPFIVWFPTISAKQFLKNSEWEIAPEWSNKKVMSLARKAKNLQGIRVIESNGKITQETNQVLKTIKNTNAILATGHISWEESLQLVLNALDLKIQKIIITHPIYQKIAMPIDIQKRLAVMGAKIEHSWSMWKIDKIPISKIVKQIRYIGADSCIITSDSGQSFSPTPDRALYQFCSALFKAGISRDELEIMCVKNPTMLIR